jgi:uncharacterized protein (TIGR02217 family)
MSFFDERFDECYAFGVRGGPKFSTEVVRTQGGQRYANKNWLMPLHVYEIGHAIRQKDDFETLRAFFYAVAGQFDGFLFKDWGDFEAVAQPLVLISGSTYQTYRAYVRGSRTFMRKITRPRSPIVVKRNRAGVISTISPTIAYTTGQVTVTGHVGGDTYTWTGEFDVPVAFTSDVLETIIENKNPGVDQLLIRWPTVQVEEIRE